MQTTQTLRSDDLRRVRHARYLRKEALERLLLTLGWPVLSVRRTLEELLDISDIGAFAGFVLAALFALWIAFILLGAWALWAALAHQMLAGTALWPIPTAFAVFVYVVGTFVDYERRFNWRL